jgi:hypothetical protein
MVENSSYRRAQLKDRLFAAGLKHRVCEMCGQGEDWKGRHRSLVLDHIDGVSNDHRLENLRVVCQLLRHSTPTAAGTCPGANLSRLPSDVRAQAHPPPLLLPGVLGNGLQRTHARGPSAPPPRKVERPAYEQLKEDVRTMSMLAVGRKYGVSDNAVRKWIRWYERGFEGEGETEAA